MQAEGLLDNITKFEFIIAFVVVKKTLGYVKGLTLSCSSEHLIFAKLTVRLIM